MTNLFMQGDVQRMIDRGTAGVHVSDPRALQLSEADAKDLSFAQKAGFKSIDEYRAAIKQQFAEENRDFLDMQEFSASMWYDLATQSKQIAPWKG